VGGAKPSDDLGVGVKCLSSPGIAGSPRNSFRASLRRFPGTVEPLEEMASFLGPSLPNSECTRVKAWESEGGG